MPAPRAVSRTVCGDGNHATLPEVKSQKVPISRACRYRVRSTSIRKRLCKYKTQVVGGWNEGSLTEVLSWCVFAALLVSDPGTKRVIYDQLMIIRRGRCYFALRKCGCSRTTAEQGLRYEHLNGDTKTEARQQDAKSACIRATSNTEVDVLDVDAQARSMNCESKHEVMKWSS